MATVVWGSDIGDAWLNAYEQLLPRGEVHNLTVNIASPLEEDLGVRRVIERKLLDFETAGGKDHRNPQSMDTVASTIFPVALYRPGPGAAERLFRNVARAESLRAHSRRKGWGTYIGRLTNYPSPAGARVNQLELAIDRLSARDKAWSDLYELPIGAPGEPYAPDSAGVSLGTHADMAYDARTIGNPCLAHISLTRLNGVVHMVALYRRHHYVARAYGNFLGLGRLLNFLAAESGLEPGELTVVTGHALAETSKRHAIYGEARQAAREVVPIEVGARPLGASVDDLELPRGGGGGGR
ncbi:hypothetical protein [Microbacterium sulfonylureivorans]|uniref:hypothetical protein n=1 Tax=Microbacterium sulfonylureivorans TaxID=2486854 RepID=UPI0013E0CCC7|nr:hypothetical protein [Microbacterium sulfonylureivorans]